MMIHAQTRFLIALHNFLLMVLPLLPPQISMTKVRQVLDATCGTGAWVNALLHAYPHIEVIGVEREQQMIEYARANSWRTPTGLSSFFAADILDLPISPHFFDLVHARFLPLVATREQKRRQLQALARVCSPEGYLIWTEWAWPVCNSEACGRLYQLVKHALVSSLYQCDAPHEMETLLAQALALPASTLQVQELHLHYPPENAEQHNIADLQALLIALLGLLRFFLLAQHIVRAREIDPLLLQCQDELHTFNVQLRWTLKTLVGQKPLHS